MDLIEAKRRAARALAEIVPTKESANLLWNRYELSPADFPVPELVLFGLRELNGLGSWGPAEKLRWGVTAVYRKTPFYVSSEKFGLRLHYPLRLGTKTRNELIQLLKTAAKLAEDYLRDHAQQQITTGTVTLDNQYHQFDTAYRFFREKASVAYASRPKKSKVISRDKAGRPTGWTSDPFRPQREGGYFAGAMLDAYFSRLEHLLVLILPFLDFDPAAGALLRYVGLTWDQKWCHVFNVARDKNAKLAYDRLRQIKESIRNPISHGGFRKKGTSFFFHVENVGALPALLSKHERSFDLLITRVPESTYEQLCSLLDQVDAFLASSHIAAGIRYAQSGLSLPFSADFRKACKLAAKSPDSLEKFIDYYSYLEDTHANMDY
jgi:hypothetical protein